MQRQLHGAAGRRVDCVRPWDRAVSFLGRQLQRANGWMGRRYTRPLCVVVLGMRVYPVRDAEQQADHGDDERAELG